MRDALAHLLFGVDHSVGPDPLQDRAVELRRRLRDDLRYAEVLERHRREDARVGGAADRDDRELEIACADGLEGALVRGIELGGMGDLGRNVVDDRFIPIEREDFVAERHELERRGRPEPTQTDDQDRWLHDRSPSWWFDVAWLIRCASSRWPGATIRA